MLPNRSESRRILTNLFKSSWRWSPGLVAAAVVILLFKLGTWQPFENVAYRQIFRLRGERPLDPRIVVVAIDTPSINQFGEFPWPRSRYLELVKKLRLANPHVVGFTLPFNYSSSADPALAQEMSRLRSVVLADSWDARELPLYSNAQLRATNRVGHIQGNEDLDGIIRSLPLIENQRPAFGLEVSRAAQYNNVDPDLTANNFWINWASSASAIPTYSFAEVLRPGFNIQNLTHKIVLVGVTTQSIDRVGTPFDRNSSGSGVYLQATVIDNLIGNRRLKVCPEPWLLFWLLLISPLLSWQLSYYSHGRRLIAVFAIGMGWVVISIVSLHLNYWVWVCAPLGLIGLTAIAVAFSEKLYVDSLIDRQILHLWQAHQIDLIARQNALPTPALPSFSKVAKLAALAADFGRAQSAQAAITHSLSLGLVATELDGTVWFCNSVASRWLQINVGDNIERCLMPTWLSVEDWQNNLQSLINCSFISPKEIQQGEQFFILKMEPLLNWQALQRDIDDGKSIEEARVVSGALLVIEEITASKQLQSLILDVEIQRRQELTKQNIALNKARQFAELAASIKSAFLANMSHEIRTPMNAVVGLTNLLLETPLNDEQEEFVSTIKVSADHLLKIINEILDFSKLESGEMQLESIAFNLSELVEQVVGILANSAHLKGLNLSYWIDPRTPIMVEGDPTRLNQILTNLIGNAIKFTEQGGVTVDIQPDTSDLAQIAITVTDTGIGISPDNQHKLFQSFSQADASTTRKYGGTGLGLAICQRLLKLMGGEIGVESEIDRGSTFWLKVPLVSLSVPARHPQPNLLQHVPILIADSWPHRLAALAKDVTRWGMDVQTIGEVEQALLPPVLPRAALIDWKNSDAYNLIDQLVAQQVSTIVMTTFDRYESARSKLGDRVSYLFKPIKPNRLASLLQELLAPNSPVARAVDTSDQLTVPISRPSGNLSHVQILLAEDNRINQKVALRQLAKLGYQVDVANNGKEVLDKLEQKHYDLILMDCHMPVLDGYATTEAIRQLPELRRQKTVIVALTASAMQSDLEHALAVGMNDFLSKPVKIEQLQQMIEQWLGQ